MDANKTKVTTKKRTLSVMQCH